MICLFEDNEEYILSRFMLRSAPPDITCYFSCGAPFLLNKLIEIHDKNPDEFICVYCDLIPDNYKTRCTFMSLWEFVYGNSTYHRKTFIFPFRSTQYYYLKSLYEKNLINKNYVDYVELCFARTPYKDAVSKLNLPFDFNCSTQERFCKLMCMVSAYSCASTLSTNSKAYLRQDCLCDDYTLTQCSPETLRDKSLDMINTWEFKADGWGSIDNVLGCDEILKLTVEQIRLHNELVNMYEHGLAVRKSAKIDLKHFRRILYDIFKINRR